MSKQAMSEMRIVEEPKKVLSMHPKKFAMWLFMATVVMLFASWTSAYIVRQAEGNWLFFELPVLFYAILPLLVILVKVDWLQVALAWAFVGSRILHSVIHTGSNAVMRRGGAFVIGFFAVGLMWAWFGLRLFVIG